MRLAWTRTIPPEPQGWLHWRSPWVLITGMIVVVPTVLFLGVSMGLLCKYLLNR